jgi:hypothetical protein
LLHIGLLIVIGENSPDSVPASHAEVLAAVQASGLHVENIVKTIMTADIVGAYLQTVPPLQPYEIKKKTAVEKVNDTEQASPFLVNFATIAAASFIAVLLHHHYRK